MIDIRTAKVDVYRSHREWIAVLWWTSRDRDAGMDGELRWHARGKGELSSLVSSTALHPLVRTALLRAITEARG